MELDKIKLQTTWNDAAGSLNSNFAKLVQAISSLEEGGGGLDEAQLEEYLIANGYATKQWVESQNYLTEGEAGNVVIFDATCSADPWSLNTLQTTTTVAEIKAAIEGNKPIYAKFANGFTPIGYAGIVAQKYVSMDIYLMDVEGGYIRTVNIYSGEGDQWSWDGFSHNLNGGGGGSIDPELLEGYMPMSRDFSDDFNNDFAR